MINEIRLQASKVAAELIEAANLKKGDIIVITGGTPNGKSGNSNLINVETI